MTPADIDIAFWPRGPEGEQEVNVFVQRYHEQNKAVHIHAHSMDVQNPWADVSHILTHRSGADITEVGASWVESLIATNSLRSFSSKEFQYFGGPDAFLIPPWKSKKGDAAETVYSIPYRADARLIFYRRDLLAQAGVDENTAFTTPKNILQTLESLKRTGIKSPLVASILTNRFINLSFIASWIWSTGADFINGAGSQVIFDQSEAISGIEDYFRAMAYIAPEFRRLEPGEVDLEFCWGNAAVALSNPGLFFTLQQAEFADVRANMGIALPPGQACRGGTHLVIWQHSLHEEVAFDFIRFLTSAQVQADLSGKIFTLPARLEAIQATPYANDPNYQMIVKAIHTGRSYGASPLWNIVEDRLSRVLVQIGSEYFETPDVDLNAFLAIRLKPLARRINITLEE
jgi:multiple sugar transport system substrate-binding protein